MADIPQEARDRPGYRPMPLALLDTFSVCTRCWSVVGRFHQESHDLWHERISARRPARREKAGDD